MGSCRGYIYICGGVRVRKQMVVDVFHSKCSNYLSGWWFGTFGLYFPIQLGTIIPTDFHIFQRGRAKNHQPVMVISMRGWDVLKMEGYPKLAGWFFEMFKTEKSYQDG